MMTKIRDPSIHTKANIYNPSTGKQRQEDPRGFPMENLVVEFHIQ